MLTHQTSLRLSHKELLVSVAMGCFISIAVVVVGYTQAWPFTPINNFFLDTFLKQAASHQASNKITIIDIDDVSLETVGQWPWPRYRIAAFIEKLSDMQPKAIGLDIIFPEPDRTALVNIQQAFKHDFNLDITFQGVPSSLTDNDGYLASVMETTGTVGANYFYFDHTGNSGSCSGTDFSITGSSHLTLHSAQGRLCNTDKISKRLQHRGFINCLTDKDGMLRQLPLLIGYQNSIYPNLTLATLLKGLGETSAQISSSNNGPYIKAGKHHIPISKTGYATLNFQGSPSLYRTISAVDVLTEKINPKDITDKYILVGSSAVGLNDLYPTLFDPLFPGIKAHAVMLESILENQFVRIPSWGKLTLSITTVFTVLAMLLLFAVNSKPFVMIFGTIGLATIQLVTSVLIFKQWGLFLSPGAPLLTTIALFALFSILRYVTEKRRSYLWFKRLAKAQRLTLESMATVAETRDPETGAHLQRTQHYVKVLAEYLRNNNMYTELLNDNYIKLLVYSAPLHDIGKVGVPDAILTKPGKLTQEEFGEIKQHAVFGEKILANTARKIEGENFLELAREIAATHHEKWDGTGYPFGLAEENIPLPGRLMAVADVYDALINKRCYKPAYSHKKAREIMIEGRGTHFDPLLLDAFIALENTFQEIAARFVDEKELVLGDR